MAYGAELAETQSTSLDVEAKKYNSKRKRNQKFFQTVECHEKYNTEVSLDDLDFS